MSDANRSIIEYQQALRLQPDEASFHVALGNALRQKPDISAAIAEFRSALRLMPSNENAVLKPRKSPNNKTQYEEVAKGLRECVRLVPQDSNARADLASAEAAMGDREGAIRDFQEVLRLSPSNSDAKKNLDSLLNLPTPDDGPTIFETMRFIQDKLNEIGEVNYVVYLHDDEKGKTFTNHFRDQVTRVTADSTICQVSYNFKEERDRKVMIDTYGGFFLRTVEDIVVMPREESLKIADTAAGHPSWNSKVDPPVFMLRVRRSSTLWNDFDFFDEQLANRVAKAMVHAVEISGGGKSESF